MADLPVTRTGEVTAVGKVAAVVEALTRFSRLASIAHAAGVPRATTHRILNELVACGWAERFGRGQYRPGKALLELSGAGRDYGPAEAEELAAVLVRYVEARGPHVAALARALLDAGYRRVGPPATPRIDEDELYNSAVPDSAPKRPG